MTWRISKRDGMVCFRHVSGVKVFVPHRPEFDKVRDRWKGAA